MRAESRGQRVEGRGEVDFCKQKSYINNLCCTNDI